MTLGSSKFQKHKQWDNKHAIGKKEKQNIEACKKKQYNAIRNPIQSPEKR
jgi:hypothetical protein